MASNTALSPGYGGDLVSDEDITGAVQTATTTSGAGTVSIGSFSLGVASTAGFLASGSLWLFSIATQSYLQVSYSGTSGGNTFTGCTVDAVTATLAKDQGAPTWTSGATVAQALVKLARSKIVLGASGTDDGDVSATNPLPITMADVTTSGALGALNAAISISMSGLRGAVMQLPSSGNLVGVIVAELSRDGGTSWDIAEFYNPLTGAVSRNVNLFADSVVIARSIYCPSGTSNVRVRVAAYTSGTITGSLRGNVTDTTPLVKPDITGRRLDGSTRTLLLQDLDTAAIGTTNTALWTSTVSGGGSITGLLLSVGATNGDTAILPSKQRFYFSPSDPVAIYFIAGASSGANAFCECGLGNPAGTTAIQDGAYFKVDSSGNITGNLSANGARSSITLGTTVVVSAIENYLKYGIELLDYGVRFLVEDFYGNLLADGVINFPDGAFGPPMTNVGHLSIFARVYNTGASSSSFLQVQSITAYRLDTSTFKDWPSQMAATSRGANINPTTFAQNAQLAAGAAPATKTPANTTSAYATLGGEFVLQNTASNENLLGVFGYQVPSPFSFYLTDILFPPPVVTTALGATVEIQEWCLMVASSANPSTATGFRNTLGLYSAAASAVAGTVFNGQAINPKLGTPIVVYPGQFLLVLVKVISGSVTGIYRGSIFINGYFE